MITYIQKDNHLTIEVHQKLILKNETYKTKQDGTRKYTYYDTTLPHVIIEYLQPENNTLYFYIKNDQIYLTSHSPGSLYESFPTKITKLSNTSNILNVPINITELYGECNNIIFTFDPCNTDFFTGKRGEISVTIK